MVSVPRVLKVLRQHFEELENVFKSLESKHPIKKQLATILSVLCSTFSDPERKSLKYVLEGCCSDLTSWGHEYLQYISTQIVAEYESRRDNFFSKQETHVNTDTTDSFSIEDLLFIVFQIIGFYIQHRNEVDAIDLLIELKHVEHIIQYTDLRNYSKVTQYLLAYADYTAIPDDYICALTVVYNISMNLKLWCEAGRVAIKLNDKEKLLEIFKKCDNELSKIQLCYFLMDIRCYLLSPQELNPNSDTILSSIIENKHILKFYKYLAKELEVIEPKLPEDVYKTRTLSHSTSNMLLMVKENVTSSIVNGFVNMGFGSDLLITNDWIHMNKEQSLLIAIASLGLIYKWDIENGSKIINKHLNSNDIYIKTGALMASGLISTDLAEKIHPLAFYANIIESECLSEKIGAILSLAFSYANVPKDEFLELFVPLIMDLNLPIEVSAFSAIALGLTFVTTANESAIEVLSQTIIDRFLDNKKLHPLNFCFGLALGLVLLCRKSDCEHVIDNLQRSTIKNHPMVQYSISCIEAFAFAGSGDVSKIQKFMKYCTEFCPQSEHQFSTQPSSIKEDLNLNLSNMPAASTVLALPLIALGENIGMDMILRLLDHLLQYGKPHVRAAVPLALALLSPSNPKSVIIDVLSRLSHDPNYEVCTLAIIALGIVGAGTNHARIADLLQQLANLYKQHESKLYFVRISQGLLYMGKGLLTLSPLQSDRYLINITSLSSLLIAIHSILYFRHTLEKSNTYLIYFLALAARTHSLITVDNNLEPISVVVRIGQAVDTTGQAGCPKTITGFQTHNTPVLYSETDRIEMGNSDSFPNCTVPLEGIVILNKN